MKWFVYCFTCWHHAWLEEAPDISRRRCSKCGGTDVAYQAVDPEWGRRWSEDYDSWVASYLASGDLTGAVNGVDSGG